MLRFKETGLKRYDWGGSGRTIPYREALESTSSKRPSAGGKNKGRIWLPLRDAWRRRHRRGANNQIQVINNPRLDDPARPEDVLHVGESLFGVASSAPQRQLVVVVLLALIAIALWRIASTYAVLNHTFDEPAHIAVGLQYVDRGTYPWDHTHPPMRAVYGIGPYLMGIRAFGEADAWHEGSRILYESGRYFETLTAARVAALPFFVLAVVLVFAWARSLAGPVAGLLAAMLYSTLPLALAHAGLATTDILVTATLTLALLAWAYWLASPSHSRALLFGCAAGLAVASKFSAIPFLGIVVAASGLAWLLPWRGRGAI